MPPLRSGLVKSTEHLCESEKSSRKRKSTFEEVECAAASRSVQLDKTKRRRIRATEELFDFSAEMKVEENVKSVKDTQQKRKNNARSFLPKVDFITDENKEVKVTQKRITRNSIKKVNENQTSGESSKPLSIPKRSNSFHTCKSDVQPNTPECKLVKELRSRKVVSTTKKITSSKNNKSNSKSSDVQKTTDDFVCPKSVKEILQTKPQPSAKKLIYDKEEKHNSDLLEDNRLTFDVVKPQFISQLEKNEENADINKENATETTSEAHNATFTQEVDTSDNQNLEEIKIIPKNVNFDIRENNLVEEKFEVNTTDEGIKASDLSFTDNKTSEEFDENCKNVSGDILDKKDETQTCDVTFTQEKESSDSSNSNQQQDKSTNIDEIQDNCNKEERQMNTTYTGFEASESTFTKETDVSTEKKPEEITTTSTEVKKDSNECDATFTQESPSSDKVETKNIEKDAKLTDIFEKSVENSSFKETCNITNEKCNINTTYTGFEASESIFTKETNVSSEKNPEEITTTSTEVKKDSNECDATFTQESLSSDKVETKNIEKDAKLNDIFEKSVESEEICNITKDSNSMNDITLQNIETKSEEISMKNYSKNMNIWDNTVYKKTVDSFMNSTEIFQNYSNRVNMFEENNTEIDNCNEDEHTSNKNVSFNATLNENASKLVECVPKSTINKLNESETNKDCNVSGEIFHTAEKIDQKNHDGNQSELFTLPKESNIANSEPEITETSLKESPTLKDTFNSCLVTNILSSTKHSDDLNEIFTEKVENIKTDLIFNRSQSFTEITPSNARSFENTIDSKITKEIDSGSPQILEKVDEKQGKSQNVSNKQNDTYERKEDENNTNDFMEGENRTFEKESIVVLGESTENSSQKSPKTPATIRNRRSTFEVDKSINRVDLLKSICDDFGTPKETVKSSKKFRQTTPHPNKLLLPDNILEDESIICLSDVSDEKNETNSKMELSDENYDNVFERQRMSSYARFKVRRSKSVPQMEDPSLNEFLLTEKITNEDYERNITQRKKVTFKPEQEINFESPLCSTRIGKKFSTSLPSLTQKIPSSTPKVTSILEKSKECNKKVIKTKMPNFAAIHKNMFDRMEDIKQHSQRKAERTKLLLSGGKPVSSNENSNRSKTSTTTSKKHLNFQSTSSQNVLKPVNIHPEKLENKNGPKKAEIKPTFKFGIPAKSEDVQTKGKMTKFGFKVVKGAKTPTKEEQKKAITSKSKILKNTRKDQRNIIQGVRSNRRFDLLMKMREKKN